MKFACPKCSTRYAIADDKVPAGKTVRFPCKSCGTAIRLRRKETAAAPQRQPPREMDPTSTRVASRLVIEQLRGASVAPDSGREGATAQNEAPTRVLSAAAPQRPSPSEMDSACTRVASRLVIEQLRGVSLAPDSGHKDTGAQNEAPATRVVAVDELDRLRSESARDTGQGRAVAPAPAGDLEEWYALVAGKQRGPESRSAIEAMLRRHELDKRTYVWRDGMDDWKRLGDIGEFAALAAQVGGAAWRVMAPIEEPAAGPSAPAGGPAPLVDDFEEQTVVARPAGAAVGPFAGASGAVTDSFALNGLGGGAMDASGVERVVAAATDPFLLGGLLGEPTGDQLARAPGEEEASPVADLPTRRFGRPASSAPAPEAITGVLSTTPPPAAGAASYDAGYYAAAPGESTRVFMAAGGLYKRRRNQRVAAVVSALVSVALVAVVTLDVMGYIQIPGMGMVYDMTGMVDPNTERAVSRVETKLIGGDLTPEERARLEALRQKLAGGGQKPGRARKAGAVQPTVPQEGKTAEAGEGVKETATLTDAQRTVAADIFGSDDKKEAKLTLDDAKAIQAPNLPSGLTQEAIFTVITDSSRSMNLCLAEAMRKGEKLQGKMEIELTIMPDGSVSEVRIDAPQFKNSVMASCAVRRIRGWRFPAFNGEPVTVSYPYLLQMGF